MRPTVAAALTKLAASEDEELGRFIAASGPILHHARSRGHGALSPREIEVMRVMSDGGSDKAVGRLLNISEHGVRFHLKSVYRKLDVRDRVSAINRARKSGVLDLPDQVEADYQSEPFTTK